VSAIFFAGGLFRASGRCIGVRNSFARKSEGLPSAFADCARRALFSVVAVSIGLTERLAPQTVSATLCQRHFATAALLLSTRPERWITVKLFAIKLCQRR
jgi:hypothetical protein